MEAWQTAKHVVYGFSEKAVAAQASVAAAREVDNTKKRRRAAQVVTLNKRLSKLQETADRRGGIIGAQRKAVHEVEQVTNKKTPRIELASCTKSTGRSFETRNYGSESSVSSTRLSASRKRGTRKRSCKQC